MRVTKKNIYSLVGRKCTVKFSKKIYLIVGMNSKSKVLLLEEGEADGIINRKQAYMSDVKVIEER